MSIKFGFSKISTKRKLNTTSSSVVSSDSKHFRADKDDDNDDGEKIEYIQSIEGNGVAKQSEGQVSNELIIPLIVQNRWNFPKDSPQSRNKNDKANQNQSNGSTDAKDNSVSQEDKDKELEAQAIREILSGGGEDDKESVLNIPLLVQNKIPDGFETDDNLDVSLRPAEPTLDDYERIPVEEFGLAMLRGMGWKKEEGIGLRNKTVVEYKEPELRPRGLGLGATKPNTDSNSANSNHNSSSNKHSSSSKNSSRSSSPPNFGLRLSKNKK